VTTSDIATAFIVFGEAVFAFAMAVITRKMLTAIYKKNDEIVHTLVNAIEAKDEYTRGHSVHVENICKLIYEYLPADMKSGVNLSSLTTAAILHDIGKIGIHDSILNKPDKLTEEEFSIIKQHPKIGKQIFEKTSYESVAEILYCHHERVDGKGYYGITAEDIPAEAKIIAIADTYSALCTSRVYRTARSHDEAVKIIKDAAGTQLDADLADIFSAIPESKLTSLIGAEI
jgi:HD-GYP domain-containing protein (c-di-GMP phosphodiesterase class II)